MGLTFKENCPDIRNSKVIDIAKNLHKKGSIIECYDPWVRQIDNINIRNIKFISFPKKSYYDCILLAVAHNNIKKILENQNISQELSIKCIKKSKDFDNEIIEKREAEIYKELTNTKS